MLFLFKGCKKFILQMPRKTMSGVHIIILHFFLLYSLLLINTMGKLEKTKYSNNVFT